MNSTPLGVIVAQLDESKGVVVLDRIADNPKPDYCVHGHVQCPLCQQWCLLGEKTIKVVTAGTTPVCLPCAQQHITAETPTLHIEDGYGDHD